MNKSKVMEALLDSSCNVPSEIVSFVGANLPSDGECQVINFDHDQNSMFEACGIKEQDTRDFVRALNEHMNSLPSGERAKSKSVEFIFNANNPKWNIICILGAIQHLEAQNNDSDAEMKELMKKIIMKKLLGE